MKIPGSIKQALHHDQHTLRLVEGEYCKINEVINKLEKENKRMFDLLRSRHREENEFLAEMADEAGKAVAEIERLESVVSAVSACVDEHWGHIGMDLGNMLDHILGTFIPENQED